MKISYLAKWNTKNDFKTWSGTTYSLLQALEEKFEVERIDVNDSGLLRFIYKTSRRLYFKKKFLLAKELLKLYNVIIGYEIQKKIDPQVFKFQVFDFPIEKNFSIYQDGSYSALAHYKHTRPELFKYSGFNSEQMILDNIEIQQNNYRNAEYIFTMGKWLHDFLINEEGLSESKVIHVGGGVNVDITRITKDCKERKRFLFVGRDFVRKGGDLVVKAFQKIRKTHNDMELIIAGPKEIEESFLIEGVIFLGEIMSDELPDLYNLCDVFVMPSRFELYGLVFPEALSFGLPCIGRNAFEMPYFIKEGLTGELVQNDDIDELAIKMINVIQNESYFENCSSIREFYLSEYSWNSVAERIYKVLSGKLGDKNEE